MHLTILHTAVKVTAAYTQWTNETNPRQITRTEIDRFSNKEKT